MAEGEGPIIVDTDLSTIQSTDQQRHLNPTADQTTQQAVCPSRKERDDQFEQQERDDCREHTNRMATCIATMALVQQEKEEHEKSSAGRRELHDGATDTINGKDTKEHDAQWTCLGDGTDGGCKVPDIDRSVVGLVLAGWPAGKERDAMASMLVDVVTRRAQALCYYALRLTKNFCMVFHLLEVLSNDEGEKAVLDGAQRALGHLIRKSGVQGSAEKEMDENQKSTEKRKPKKQRVEKTKKGGDEGKVDLGAGEIDAKQSNLKLVSFIDISTGWVGDIVQATDLVKAAQDAAHAANEATESLITKTLDTDVRRLLESNRLHTKFDIRKVVD
jgi:hypothetical protein